MFNLLNIVAKRFKSLERCLQMASGTWYIISIEVQNSSPQMMPKIPPKIPPKTSHLGPPERIFKVWELCHGSPLYVSMETHLMFSWQPTLCFHSNPPYVSLSAHCIFPSQPTLSFHGNPLYVTMAIHFMFPWQPT